MYVTNDKLIRAIRLIIGVIVAYAICLYFKIPDSAWIYISLLVVVSEQSTIGGVLNRSYLRAFGTVSSAIYGIAVIWVFNNNDIMNLIAVCFGLFVYLTLYLGTIQSYIGTLGSMTLVIVLFNDNNMTDAFIRPFNVIIGITIGLVLMYFFYPQRATSKFISGLQAIITELNNLTREIDYSNFKDLAMYNRYMESERTTVNRIYECRNLINDARVETYKVPEFTLICTDALSIVLRVTRYYSSTVYSMVSHKIQHDVEVKSALDLLMQTFTIVHSTLVINFNTFDQKSVLKHLSQLEKSIKNITSHNHFLLTMVGFVINESKELIDKFTELREISHRVKL